MNPHRRPCETCDAVISLADLERGRAVMVLKRAYCGRCSERIAASGTPAAPRTPLLLAVLAGAVALGALLVLWFARRPI